jgi:hypothetical protein
MTDREAAQAAGLNPDTAAYTKSKPRVRDYMIEHRNAVREKLVDQEAEGLRKLNLSRDQILTRLWELARLSHEETRGTIAGQIKALSMIVAIEGLVPDRRLSSSAGKQPAAPPVKAQIYESQWLRQQHRQPVAEEPGDPDAGTKTPPAAPQVELAQAFYFLFHQLFSDSVAVLDHVVVDAGLGFGVSGGVGMETGYFCGLAVGHGSG